MSTTDVRWEFSNNFSGTLHAAHGTAQINLSDSTLLPYDMLLGSLGSCYYSTFLDIAEKMRLTFDKADLQIHGVKREEPPTHLTRVDMVFTLYGAEDNKSFRRAADLAAKYCSIHHTISQVADINLTVVFA